METRVLDTGTDLRLYYEWYIDGDVLFSITEDDVIFLTRIVFFTLSNFRSEKLGLFTVLFSKTGARRVLANAHEVDIVRICSSFRADAENGSRVCSSTFRVNID